MTAIMSIDFTPATWLMAVASADSCASRIVVGSAVGVADAGGVLVIARRVLSTGIAAVALAITAADGLDARGVEPGVGGDFGNIIESGMMQNRHTNATSVNQPGLRQRFIRPPNPERESFGSSYFRPPLV